MKLAVSSSGPGMDDRMETRFGRCSYFILIDPDTLAFEPIENMNVALSGGAGIQSAQLMAEKGVTVVLTGNCGPNAFQVFNAAGIQVITGVDGTVRAAVEKFKSGEIRVAAAPSVDAHFGMGDDGRTGAGNVVAGGGRLGGGTGMGSGMGRGVGMGMGRGMGRGGGKGCGMGRGMGGGMGMKGAGGGMASPALKAGSPSIPFGRSKEEETNLLRQSADDLRRQLDSVESRIKEITKDQ